GGGVRGCYRQVLRAVAVKVRCDHEAGSSSDADGRGRTERPIPPAEQDGYARSSVRHRQVRDRIPVEVPHGDGRRPLPHGRRVQGQPEGPVAVAKEDGHIVRGGVRHGEVYQPIAIEVAGGEEGRGGSHGDGPERPERTVAIAEEDGYVVGGGVRHRHVWKSVPIEVGD